MQTFFLICNLNNGRRILMPVRDKETESAAVMSADNLLNSQWTTAKAVIVFCMIESARLTDGKKTVADWRSCEGSLKLRQRYTYEFKDKLNGSIFACCSAFRDRISCENAFERFTNHLRFNEYHIDDIQMLIHEMDIYSNIIDTIELGFFRCIMGRMVRYEMPPLLASARL